MRTRNGHILKPPDYLIVGHCYLERKKDIVIAYVSIPVLLKSNILPPL